MKKFIEITSYERVEEYHWWPFQHPVRSPNLSSISNLGGCVLAVYCDLVKFCFPLLLSEVESLVLS